MAVQGEHASDTRLPPLRRGAFWWRVGAELLRQAALFLVGFLLLTLPPGVPAPREETPGRADPRESKPAIPARADLRLLQQALDNRDDAAVLDFFRKLTLSDKERSTISALIARFSDESFEVREQAARDAIGWGPRAAALLRRATRSADPETAARARRCLGEVLKDSSPSLLVRAAQYVKNHRPPEAAVVLLAYLPDAEDESVATAVTSALVRVAFKGGTVVEAVVRALDDPLPERRAAAGIVLYRRGEDWEYHKAVDRLLSDPVPEVRREIAWHMVSLGGEPKALPVLIGLLGDLPPDDAWPIVDLLWAVAGARGPAVAPGNDVAGRARCRDAWSAWWREHGAKADLSEATPIEIGGALLVYLNPRNQVGSVAQLRPDETSIWQIEGLEYPLYAETLSDERVLIAEYEGERISERNFRGEVLWSKELGRPVLSAHRLPGGNTFVVHRNRVVELDRDGKEVFVHRRPVRDLTAARRLPDGQVVLLTDTGDCVFLDASGREVRRFATGARQVLGAGFDVLPNRRILVPHFTENKVIEYGPTGEVLWQAEVRSPTSVQRLSGGATLVASTETREVIQIDRAGKELWKHTAPPSARPVCALRR